ncbi:carbohydrate-selective porin, OprB family [mine drainage metagenome]|uniref:Carbohydrate-selective porin, OprB family n=1 Tax=mine drainage metagenome TaxID=410659 RepID=A0A1J5RZN9_9ZZZZ
MFKAIKIVRESIVCLFTFGYSITNLSAQSNSNNKESNWTNHFQLTVISQSHSGFKSNYTGNNSLADTVEVGATSVTSTIFLGRKLWKGAAIYFNPEIAGGKGLNCALGVAGALNGETYRVGNPEPRVFIARGYLQQFIPLKRCSYVKVDDDLNQVKDLIPDKRIVISAGKFAISDFYDNNAYSHDPRTQFLNWSIMANGAWDYPANTRGYTFGAVIELIHPFWAIRFSSVAVPTIANASTMEYRISKARSETIEFEKSIKIHNHPGSYKFIISNTFSKAPSYQEGLQAICNKDSFLLNVIAGKQENNKYGGRKFGLAFNAEQELSKEIGFFSRVGWNDGKYASWAFTEIDRTVNLGVSVKGNKWNRPNDVLGVAAVINGISNEHRAFLKAGGYGFIIGDGNLKYANECIFEIFYNTQLSKIFWLTLDYQFVKNTAYNKDRNGPVNVFGIRGHIKF